MTTLQRLKHEARRAEQRSDWRRAIALYRDAVGFDEQTGTSSDLSLWNRIGDLHMRLGEIPAAVQCYEHAADRYAEHDLPTSAIAICNKILRIDPARDIVLRRLARLHATTGLTAEGRTACLQFVEKALGRGDVAEALEAVQEFVDRTGDERIRSRSAEILEAAGLHEQARAQRRLASGVVSEDPQRPSEVPPPLPPEPCPPEPLERQARPSGPAEAPVSTPDPGPGGSPGSPAVAGIDWIDPELRRRLGVEAPVRDSDPQSELSAGPDGPRDDVGAAVARFRECLGERLVEAGPEVRYDLGVAFQAMGLVEEAVRELRVGIAAPGRLRAAHARIAALMAREQGTGERSGEPVAGPACAPEPGSVRKSEAAPEPEGVPEADPVPDPVPAGPAPEGGGESGSVPDGEPGDEDGRDSGLHDQFFQARLAQYQVRQAEGRRETDHRAHLDLGAAYAALGLAEEAVRELVVALLGPRIVSDRAAAVLREVACEPDTEPRLAAAVRRRLVEAGHEAPLPEDGEGAAFDVAGPEESADPSGVGAGRVDALLSGIDEASRAPAVRPTVPPDAVRPSRIREEAIASADELLAAGRADEAAALLYEALERYEAERRVAEAFRIVDRLLDLRPDDVVLHHQKAELAMMLEDRAALAEAYADLAASLLRQGAPRAARTVYERLLEEDPAHSEARDALARLESRTPETTTGPDSPRASPEVPARGAARSAAGKGEFDDLLDDLREDLPGSGEPEDDPDAHFELGIAFKQMEMWEEALGELERSIPGLADPRPAQEAVGECLVRLGRHEPALEVLAEAESLYPEGEERARLGILYWRARALTRLGREEEAGALLARIVTVEPDFLDAARRLSALSP